MVKELEKNGNTVFLCEECGLYYNEITWSEKCETWCGINQTCNVEITKHRVKNTEQEGDK